MPKPSPSSSASTSRQFQITSFLPRGFGTPPASTTPSTSASESKGKRKRRVVESEEEEDDEVEILDPEEDKKKKSNVIDLTETDDEEEIESMPPPPVPTRKREKKPTTTSSSKKKGKEKAKEPEKDEQEDERMWIDKFVPTSREELALHSKKVTDVSNWFQETFPSNGIPTKLSQKYRRLLVLSGPSGSGKTTCLRILAKEFGVEILEWKEESNVINANDEYQESMVHRFTSFLTRAGMVPSLEFVDSPSSPSSSSSSPPHPSAPFAPDRPRLILLEDLPNVSHYPTKLALRSALAQYLSSPRVNCPLVLIVSETLTRPGKDDFEQTGGGGSFRGDENLDSRSVCGLQVLQHPACREISFNPIAQTIMKKALNRILDQVESSPSSSSSSRSNRPSGSMLDILIQNSNGDIRSALMSLQFLSTQDQYSLSTSLSGGSGSKGTSSGKGRKKAKTTGGGGDVKELLQFVTARENSLFIFHALGKVLYNKRWGESEKEDKKDLNRPGIRQELEPSSKLPKHLRKEWNRKPSKVDPDVVFAEAPIDSEIFLTYLHHNYPQFTSSSIESCSSILDSLSLSDSLLRLESNEEQIRRLPLTSLYSFAVGVRGTLLGLPSPVEREKQVLRKSEWWENERLRKTNLEGVVELSGVREGGGDEEDAGWLGRAGGGNKKSLLTETIPWLGVMKPPNVNPFLIDLAQFPPLSFDNKITGEALGEKDIKPEDAEDAEVQEDVEGVPKRLEETEEVKFSKLVGEEESWFELEDDIVDED
ncbi:Rad24p [Sporobolomyces salmoneus]|uniref:Rad24p n=1 Tax=Sporobolomyces salmoneus TaxID=183962 RepID=UPI00316EF133